MIHSIKLIVLISLLGTLSALGEESKSTLKTVTPMEVLQKEVKSLEQEVQQLTTQLNSIPAGNLGQIQPVERQLNEKKKSLFEKQRALAALEKRQSQNNLPAPELSKEESRSLAAVIHLLKTDKESAAIDAWKDWLKLNQRPNPKQDHDLQRLISYVAESISDQKASLQISKELEKAAGK